MQGNELQLLAARASEGRTEGRRDGWTGEGGSGSVMMRAVADGAGEATVAH